MDYRYWSKPQDKLFKDWITSYKEDNQKELTKIYNELLTPMKLIAEHITNDERYHIFKNDEEKIMDAIHTAFLRIHKYKNEKIKPFTYVYISIKGAFNNMIEGSEKKHNSNLEFTDLYKLSNNYKIENEYDFKTAIFELIERCDLYETNEKYPIKNELIDYYNRCYTFDFRGFMEGIIRNKEKWGVSAYYFISTCKKIFGIQYNPNEFKEYKKDREFIEREGIINADFTPLQGEKNRRIAIKLFRKRKYDKFYVYY